MLEALSDGRRWSTVELAGLGMTPHSRKSDLKKLGYTVEVRRTATVRGEKDVYFYRLLAVPPLPVLPFESGLEDDARAAIERLRIAGVGPSLAVPPESSASHRQVGPVAAAAVVPVGGEPGAGLPSRSSSRSFVERDNEAASNPLGAPADGLMPGPSAAPSLLAGDAGAPPGGLMRLDAIVGEELAGIEDQLAALAADALTFEDVELLEELEQRRNEILGMGWAA